MTNDLTQYEDGDYLLLSRTGDVLAVSGNSEFSDVENPPTESSTVVVRVVGPEFLPVVTENPEEE